MERFTNAVTVYLLEITGPDSVGAFLAFTSDVESPDVLPVINPLVARQFQTTEQADAYYRVYRVANRWACRVRSATLQTTLFL